MRDFAERGRGRRTIYLSTPITTGPRYLEWRISTTHVLSEGDEAYARELKQQVIVENLSRVKPLLARVKKTHEDYLVIDPTELEMSNWSQGDYHRFWAEVIWQLADVAVFADGWHYSTGCALEYAVAVRKEIPCLDSGLRPLVPEHAHVLLTVAAEQLNAARLDARVVEAVAERCRELTPRPASAVLKDERLASMAREFNVARFVSFGPDARLRHCVLGGEPPKLEAADVEGAIANLMRVSNGVAVNVRTFNEEGRKSGPFEYGLQNAASAARLVKKYAAQGFFTIVNQTIDIHDGGVSGVSLGGLVEFSPDDTPRAVEKFGTASLPIDAARRLLSEVYGTALEIPSERGQRFEFSVHPRRVGHLDKHILLWEAEDVGPIDLRPEIQWPNNFSRLLGDKTYGLLIAHVSGAHVPLTRVVNRRVAPFDFGVATGTNEWWLRTAPAEQSPGHFTTTRGWVDPFELIAREDPRGVVSSVLSQEAVDAQYSGASVPRRDGSNLIEGVAGVGDDFMLGAREPENLPSEVTEAVSQELATLAQRLGPVRIEWAFDGARVWVLQLHRSAAAVEENVVSPGTADTWLDFDVREGLDSLNELIEKARATDSGILVRGRIGVTSHVGDLLRKAAVPARVAT